MFNVVVMPDVAGDKRQPLFECGCRDDDVRVGKGCAFLFKRRLRPRGRAMNRVTVWEWHDIGQLAANRKIAGNVLVIRSIPPKV